MKLHTQAPLVVEGKLSDSERMKKRVIFYVALLQKTYKMV